MNVALWIVSGLLAAVYLAAGLTKLTQPRQKLADGQMGWAGDMTDRAVKSIGGAELLGAIGLILPWALGMAKVLTPLAAVGLVVVQLGAIVVHLRRKESKVVPGNLVLLALAAFVAVGRFAGL
ncbi:DoxX family protein [Actinocrispum sp. NPDC049592]|uniref:DoxX family protein n=1 Tax=Actinocrispum sp. NPDC049592 TaxID=3154835 RepID=UPI00342584CF